MAETLKEYLISIGYKVDQLAQKQAEDSQRRAEERATDRAEKAAAQRAKAEAQDAEKADKARALATKRDQEHFNKSLSNFRSFSTKFLGIQALLGVASGLTAAKIIGAVDSAAKSYERLGYLSKRTGTSVTNAGAFGYASSQLGSSTEEANASLEAFGKNLRTNGTGYAESLDRVLSRIGRTSRDTNGHLRDSAELATDLGDALRELQEHGGKDGYARAIATARSFGFEENQARAMMNGGFRGREDQFRSDQKRIGANPDDAAERGTAFEQSMRRLQEVLEAIGTRLSGELFVKLKPLLDQLTDWLMKDGNGQRITGILSRVATDLIALAQAITSGIAGADWDKILGDVETLGRGFATLVDKLGGNAGLVALLALLAVRLRVLSALALNPWIATALGLTAGGVAAYNNLSERDQKNIVENQGALNGAVGADGDIDNNAGSRFGRWLKRKLGRSDETEQRKLPASSTSGNLTKLTEEAAAAEGIDPRIMHGIRWGESNHDDHYDHATGRPGQPEDSWGPWQLNRMGGLGTEFEKETEAERKRLGLGGLEDPRTIPMQTHWVARYIKKHGRRALSLWHGYSGDRDALPEWRDSGYVPAPKPAKTPPMMKAPAMPQAPKDGPVSQKTSLGPSPLQRMQIATSVRGNLNVDHTPTFNIQGGHDRSMDVAGLSADRGFQDLLRNIQGAEA